MAGVARVAGIAGVPFSGRQKRVTHMDGTEDLRIIAAAARYPAKA